MGVVVGEAGGAGGLEGGVGVVEMGRNSIDAGVNLHCTNRVIL